jgi:hypothetical protein
VDDLIAFLRARLVEAEQDSQSLLMREGQSLVVLRLARERLAEVEAKRRIFKSATEVRGYEDQIDNEWGDGRWVDDASDRASVQILRALALPYAGHPDYRTEWQV